MLRRLPQAVPAVICLLALLTTAALAAAPPQVPPPPTVGAKAYIVADHQSGKVIASLRENDRLDPASITKLMTAYVVFRAIRDKRIGLEDPVTISETAWRTGGSRSFIDLGSQVPVSVLLQGVIVQSGNDASVALAEHVAGSESAFADLMNQYAKELGMTGTSYRNATGLPDPEHYTTAADILKVANAIISEFPQFYKWYSQKEFSWNGITQSNRNGLLWRDSTVDGMKTGFTEAAGYCLVSSALRDNMRLVSVVLGTDSPSARERDSQTLLNYGFRFYQTAQVLTAGKPVVEARVWKAGVDMTSLGARETVWVTIPRGAADQIKTVPSIPPQLIAPLETGREVGQVEVRLDDQVVAKAPLYPLADVPEGSLYQQARDTVLLWLE